MNRYPTDEELSRFIEELEQEELYAPKHLKEEILLKAQKQVENEEAGNKKAQPVSFLMYTLKMAAGMAAAVLLVFMIPAGNGSNISRAQMQEKKWSISEENIWDKDWEKENPADGINERINRKSEEADAAFNELYLKIDNLFDRNDLGGYYDEN